MRIKEKFLSYLLFKPRGSKPDSDHDEYGIKKLQPEDDDSPIYRSTDSKNLHAELLDLEKSFKVYKYHSLLQVPFSFGFNRGYGVENYFLKRIPRSLFANGDQSEADAYLIPATPYMYYVGAQLWMFFKRFLRGGKSTGPKGNNPFLKKRKLIEKPLNAVMRKVSNSDNFKQSRGSAHIFFSSKLGTECLENVNEDLLKNGVLVVNSADSKRGPFNFEKDVSAVCMKDYKIPKFAYDLEAFEKGFHDREHFTYYAGMIYGWRKKIEKLKTTECHWVIGHLPFEDYLTNYAKSKFYFHFPGSSEWSPRLFEGMFFGAIPVVFYNKYTLPFSDILDWSKFAILIHVDQVKDTYEILKAVSEEQWETLQKNLGSAIKHFCYHRKPVIGDAFYMTMYSIYKRIKKSNT